MPIYEYVCQGCAARIEVKQKVNDPPLTTCERCGKALTKVISAPGIMFKGSGWYVTDYSDKLKPTGGAQGEKSNGQTGESDATPADAKAPASPPTPAASSPGASGGTASGASAPSASKASSGAGS